MLSEYNAAYTSGMALEHFRMLNDEFWDKDRYVIPEQAPLIILDIKSAICVVNNGKDTKHTIHISRRINFVINYKECNFHNIVRCEAGLKLADIETNNVREDEFNPILGYSRLGLDSF